MAVRNVEALCQLLAALMAANEPAPLALKTKLFDRLDAGKSGLLDPAETAGFLKALATQQALLKVERVTTEACDWCHCQAGSALGGSNCNLRMFIPNSFPFWVPSGVFHERGGGKEGDGPRPLLSDREKTQHKGQKIVPGAFKRRAREHCQ